MILAALALLPTAVAFCGTFVGAAGSDLRNRASEVVVARQDERTTLTLSADYEGDLTEFALVIPVPEVVTEEDVAVLDPALLDRVAEWSDPRLVAYTCDDVVSVSRSECGFGCGDYALSAKKSAGGYEYADTGWAVDVEAHFIEGEYEIVVLSAEESADLWGWLDANGYSPPEGGEAVLQEYIDAGSYFLAARVRLDALEDGRNWLSPLQIAYTSEAWTLPIRIGTTNAGGEAQEVIVYALTLDGGVGIANYPRIEVEDECMLRDADFGAAYEAALTDAFGGQAGWITEYSWSLTTSCDPCTATQGLTPDELGALGFPDYHGWFSRLRVRYTPEQATEDLTLYSSNLQEPGQIRYIRYLEELESVFPVCGEGMVEDPGVCEAGERAPVVGCAAGSPGVGAFGALAGVLAAAAVRRRR